MGKLISGAVGVFMALAGPLFFIAVGAFAIWSWDRRPEAWPHLAVGPCPVCIHLGFGDGLGAQRDAALARAKLDEANVATLRQAIATQNAAFAQMQATSRAWQQRSVDAVTQAGKANAWREATSAKIAHMTLPANTDELTACRASEALLRGASR